VTVPEPDDDCDECEWYPSEGRPACEKDETHGNATVSLGDGQWHLCASCAALPAFDRFRVRKPLPGAGGAV